MSKTDRAWRHYFDYAEKMPVYSGAITHGPFDDGGKEPATMLKCSQCDKAILKSEIVGQPGVLERDTMWHCHNCGTFFDPKLGVPWTPNLVPLCRKLLLEMMESVIGSPVQTDSLTELVGLIHHVVKNNCVAEDSEAFEDKAVKEIIAAMGRHSGQARFQGPMKKFAMSVGDTDKTIMAWTLSVPQAIQKSQAEHKSGETGS